MAVALGTGTPTRSLTPANGTGGTSSSWTISGSNLYIEVQIAYNSDTVTVTGVSWSLGSGTTGEIVSAVNTGTMRTCTWRIPAPTAGAGTYTVTLSAAVDYQISANYYTGVDQSNPSPSADAVGNSPGVHDGVAVTLSPSNVGANDAMSMQMSHVAAGDSAGWDVGTTAYENNTTAVNMLTGYRLAAGSMTSAVMSSGSGAHQSAVATRIAAPSAAPSPPVSVPIHGYGAMSC